MGNNFIKNIKLKFKSSKNVRFLMLGLDGAGKTTIIYNLKLSEIVTTIPTIGFNVETIEYKKTRMIIWDIGGQDKIRYLWGHYYENTQGIIYVIDSSDKERIIEAKQELHKVLNDKSLYNVTVIIFANKQDIYDCLNIQEIIKYMELEKIKQKWHIQQTCGITKQGIYEGFNWLLDNI